MVTITSNKKIPVTIRNTKMNVNSNTNISKTGVGIKEIQGTLTTPVTGTRTGDTALRTVLTIWDSQRLKAMEVMMIQIKAAETTICGKARAWV